jgi:hypothetical protein
MSTVEGAVTISVALAWDSTRTYEHSITYSLTWLTLGSIAAVDIVHSLSGSGHEFATALVGKNGVRWIYSSDRTPMRGLPVPAYAEKIGEALRTAIFGVES